MRHDAAFDIVVDLVAAEPRIASRKDHHAVQTVLVHLILKHLATATAMDINAGGMASENPVTFDNGTAVVLYLHACISISKDSVLLDAAQRAVVSKHSAFEILVNLVVDYLRIASILDLNALKLILVQLVFINSTASAGQNEDTAGVPFINPVDLDGGVALLFHFNSSQPV